MKHQNPIHFQGESPKTLPNKQKGVTSLPDPYLPTGPLHHVGNAYLWRPA